MTRFFALFILAAATASPALAADPKDRDGDGWSVDAGDCNDDDPRMNPGLAEVCDGLDNDCDDAKDQDDPDTDTDGDHVSICDPDPDCDDTNEAINPFAVEVCDGIDNDCASGVDEDFDQDGDGFTQCGKDGEAGTEDDDCHDGNPGVYPEAIELCDGGDNDCDGEVEGESDGDGDGVRVCDGDCDDGERDVYPFAPELCDDLDNDCDPDTIPAEKDADGDGFSICDGDCDDDDKTVNPDALQVEQDGIDQDCDGPDAYWCYEDLDGDLAGTDAVAIGEFDCPDGTVKVSGDCDDEDPAINPDAAEICDGIDNDCDGSKDSIECVESGEYEELPEPGTRRSMRAVAGFGMAPPPSCSVASGPAHSLWFLILAAAVRGRRRR